jgi:hypothetical protein
MAYAGVNVLVSIGSAAPEDPNEVPENAAIKYK